MKIILDLAIPVDTSFIILFNGGSHYVAITFDDAFQSILENAIVAIYEHKIPITIFVPTAYFGQHPEWITDKNNSIYSEIVMTTEQLKNLSSELVAIGSHTHTHPVLTNLDDEMIREELIKSKTELEKVLEKEVDLLAFPHGAYNEKIIEIAREVGYKYAFSIVPTFLYAKNNLFLIGRTSANPDDWNIEFRLKVLGCYNWLPPAIHLKKLIKGLFNYLF